MLGKTLKTKQNTTHDKTAKPENHKTKLCCTTLFYGFSARDCRVELHPFVLLLCCFSLCLKKTNKSVEHTKHVVKHSCCFYGFMVLLSFCYCVLWCAMVFMVLPNMFALWETHSNNKPKTHNKHACASRAHHAHRVASLARTSRMCIARVRTAQRQRDAHRAIADTKTIKTLSNTGLFYGSMVSLSV